MRGRGSAVKRAVGVGRVLVQECVLGDWGLGLGGVVGLVGVGSVGVVWLCALEVGMVSAGVKGLIGLRSVRVDWLGMLDVGTLWIQGGHVLHVVGWS